MPTRRYRVAYNTTDRPVPIDDDGRIAPGGEWTPVLAAAEQVRDAIAAGVLVLVDEPDDLDGIHPDARAAIDATAALNEAAGPEELAEVADDVDATPTPAARKAAARAREDR